jgi:hypothetical protein
MRLSGTANDGDYEYKWHKALGGRESDQVASSILYEHMTLIPLSTKHLVLYSGICGS